MCTVRDVRDVRDVDSATPPCPAPPRPDLPWMRGRRCGACGTKRGAAKHHDGAQAPTSGYVAHKGVWWVSQKRRWEVSIRDPQHREGKSRYVGTFLTQELGIAAYR